MNSINANEEISELKEENQRLLNSSNEWKSRANSLKETSEQFLAERNDARGMLDSSLRKLAWIRSLNKKELQRFIRDGKVG